MTNTTDFEEMHRELCTLHDEISVTLIALDVNPSKKDEIPDAVHTVSQLKTLKQKLTYYCERIRYMTARSS